MVGVSVAYRNTGGEVESFYMPFFHRYGPNYAWELFKSRLQQIIDTKPTIYHNAKFDLVSLGTRGISAIGSNFYCTMLLAHQVGEETPVSKSLNSVAAKYLPKVVDSTGKEVVDQKKNESDSIFNQVKKAVGWANIPSGIMAPYAAYDPDLTLRIFEKIWPLVVAEGTEQNWKHRREVVRLIIDMESKGVRIDTLLCEEMAEKGHRELERLLNELGGLNPMSIKDLPILLHDQLGLPEQYHPKTGNITFDKKAMEVYETILARRNDPTAQHVLAYRGWQKSTSSNYEAYLNLLSPDGRLRPNYKLHGTKTGRFSCEKPNLQQIPRAGVMPWNGKMKACFIPDDDYVLVEADYKQLEFRLGAAYAEQPALLEIFNDPNEPPRDIFTEMSEQLHEPRDDTKTKVYSISYGAGATRISNVFNKTLAEGKKIIEEYYDTYPELRIVQKKAEWAALATGRIRLWSGRYRHFQYPKYAAFKAFNSAIQGGAADIVEKTMLRCSENGLNNNECRMLLQVHDSIVFEIRKDKLSTYCPQIKHSMESVRAEPYSDRVKFPIDLHYFGQKESLVV